MRSLIMVLVTLFLYQCSSNEDKSTVSVCVSFDERQCGGNDWLTEEIDLNDTNAKVEALKTYLSDMSIETVEVSADPEFHDIVCQACFVCPTGTRYTIEIDTIYAGEIAGLNLLNPEQVNCN